MPHTTTAASTSLPALRTLRAAHGSPLSLDWWLRRTAESPCIRLVHVPHHVCDHVCCRSGWSARAPSHKRFALSARRTASGASIWSASGSEFDGSVVYSCTYSFTRSFVHACTPLFSSEGMSNGGMNVAPPLTAWSYGECIDMCARLPVLTPCSSEMAGATWRTLVRLCVSSRWWRFVLPYVQCLA